MRIRYTLLFCLAFIFGQAQLNPNFNSGTNSGEKCLTDKRHHELYQNDPEYRQRFDANQTVVRNIINSGNRAGGVYTIPVVVHVIHLGESVGTGTNISTAQIQSAIDNLTDAYRNVGYNGVDVEIEFELAKRDPFCAPTTGINRINGSGVTGGGDNYTNVGITSNNELTIKALSNWPNSDYYNIWIVTEIDDNGAGPGTQGYAYFPGAANGRDGAVILFNSFGYDPTGSLGYNLKSYTNHNATTIHELGHGLDLFHTFEGDDIDDDGNPDTCPTAGSCASTGDECCDTDAHRRDDSDCQGGIQNTCNGVVGSTVYNNFMAYSSDVCQNRYTSDQKDRMRAALEGTRASLLTSLGATPLSGTEPATAQSCQPQTTDLGNGFGLGIFSFTVDNLTVASNGSVADGGYVEKWCANTTLDVSTLYSVNVTNRIGGNNENVKVYIDYNNDGDFSDVGEEIFSSTNNTNHNGSFTTPASPVTGTPIWIRVISDFVSNTITGPCYTPQYGQVEDYSITINAGGSPAPVANFTANQTTICQGNTVTFTNTSSDENTYNWNFGSGASPATASSVGPHVVTYSTSGTKTVTLDVTGPGGSDNETKTNYITVNSTVTPTVSISPSANPITSGTNVIFTATCMTGCSGASYQWKLNGGNVGSNSTTYSNSALVNGDQVSCVMTSGSACASPTTATSNTVTMTVNPGGGSCTSNTGPGGVGDNSTNKLWLDASTLNSTNNQTVIYWPDRSGNNYTASSTVSTGRPIYKSNEINGRPAIDFDGINDHVCVQNVAGLNGQPISWFIVGKFDQFASSSQTLVHFGHTGTSNNKNLRFTSYHGASNKVFSSQLNTNGGGAASIHTMSTNYQLYSTIVGVSTLNSSTNGTVTGAISQTFYSPVNNNAYVTLGRRSFLNDAYLNGKISEVIVFNYQLGTAQKTIVENYLSSKYAMVISNDRYAFEGTGHSYDLAGIGQAADGSNHLSARGSIVEMSDASSMANNDYLLFAHDNGSTTSSNTDVPAAYGVNGERMIRVWRADKTNDVGTVTVTFHLGGIGTGGSNLELLVDADGIFTNATRITSGFTYDAGCETATWTGVNFSDGDYFTIGTPDGSALLTSPVTELTIDNVSDKESEGISNGMNESMNSTTVKVYPNPSTGVFVVEHNIENGSLMVYDNMGRLVLNTIINSTMNGIDLTMLPAGIYQLLVTDDKQQVIYRNQLIKMKE